MEENNEYMTNENEVEVLDNEDPAEVSSGNSVNMGIAAAGAALLGGLITAGVIIRKKIKAKKEAKAKENLPDKNPEKQKGIPFGKGKRLQIVEIDQRTHPEENTPAEEE